MIQVGTRVKVLDNYRGGLTDVVGKTGRVVRVIRQAPEIETQYVLDFRGGRTKTYKSPYNNTEEEYTYNYDVIVSQSEIEEVPYDFRDKEGQLVDLGDVIVYGVSGGGILKGKVVDFRDVPIFSYGGATNTILKMKVEVADSYTSSDGGDRSVEVETKRTVWLSNKNSTLIFQKNPANRFTISIGNDMLVYGNE